VRCDIPALHAAIAPSSALHGERCALYQLATNLLEGDCPQALARDIIDSPLARNQIGNALAGRSQLASSRLIGISALAATDSAAHGLPVASRPEANSLLTDALDDIGAELERQRDTSARPRLLTKVDGDRFTSALTVLRNGVVLARSISPDLIDDLFTHVALIGILDPHHSGGLTSGSSRSFPGLVFLESPRSSIEVAEALVHESAHQKLFDLGITHDLLTIDSDRCPPFHPPWAPEDRLWSLETTLAACHAYACLAKFEQDAGVASGIRAVNPGSLLPLAHERRDYIGQWLIANGDYLGSDANTLLAGLLGRRPRTARTGAKCSDALATGYVIDAELVFHHCIASGRVLVGRRSRPPSFTG
jgi:hypothetical protein